MLRMSILAFHVSQIMTAEGEFELHPCNGVAAKVKIVKCPAPGFEEKQWDSVSINGKAVGNRQGGVKDFLELIFKAKPEIEYT